MNATNQTDEPTELISIDGELLPAEKTNKKRASPFEHDEKYISEYVLNPHLGKTSAYKVATGNLTSYAKQRAFEMHQRLGKEIEARLRERITGTIGFGMNILIDLAQNSDSDSVKAASAAKLIELGLKTNPPVQKELETRSREQIIKEIRETRARLTEIGVET